MSSELSTTLSKKELNQIKRKQIYAAKNKEITVRDKLVEYRTKGFTEESSSIFFFLFYIFKIKDNSKTVFDYIGDSSIQELDGVMKIWNILTDKEKKDCVTVFNAFAFSSKQLKKTMAYGKFNPSYQLKKEMKERELNEIIDESVNKIFNF
jgi:hypothetical protein